MRCGRPGARAPVTLEGFESPLLSPGRPYRGTLGRRAVVDPIEQELERPVRLPAPVDLVAEQHDATLAERASMIDTA